MTNYSKYQLQREKKDAEKTVRNRHYGEIMRKTERRETGMFLNKTEEKCSERKRKTGVRVTSCSLWAAGICPWCLHLDARDPDAMPSQTRPG